MSREKRASERKSTRREPPETSRRGSEKEKEIAKKLFSDSKTNQNRGDLSSSNQIREKTKGNLRRTFPVRSSPRAISRPRSCSATRSRCRTFLAATLYFSSWTRRRQSFRKMTRGGRRETQSRENTSSSSNEASSREKKNFFASSSSSLLHQSVVQKVLVVSLSLGPKALLFSPGGVSYALIKRERVRESFFSEESGGDWIGDVIQKREEQKRSKKRRQEEKKKEGKKERKKKKKKKKKKKRHKKKPPPSFFFFFFFVVVYVVSLSKTKEAFEKNATRRRRRKEEERRTSNSSIYIYIFFFVRQRGRFSNSCFLVFCIGTTSRARVCVCAYINDAGKMRVRVGRYRPSSPDDSVLARKARGVRVRHR